MNDETNKLPCDLIKEQGRDNETFFYFFLAHN